MPIYEYRCAGCGREFEKYVTTTTAGVACPTCDSPDVTRRLSLVTFRGSSPSGAPAAASMGGGGCCGGGCSCH
jgi:putative FmdB family regulatory protein